MASLDWAVVNALIEHRIGQVRCGLNHTICVSQDGMTIWSFGDGDYGKLGLGNSAAKSLPHKMDTMCGVGVKSICCGSQFSAILTLDGKLYMSGQDRICGNAESRHNTTNRPQQVSGLGNTEIVQICCGSEHMVALTSQQDIYTWGCNGEGQLGLGHTNAVTEPTKVQALSQSNINQISAGRTHTACWTSSMVNIEKSTRQLGSPDRVPDQFEAP